MQPQLLKGDSKRDFSNVPMGLILQESPSHLWSLLHEQIKHSWAWLNYTCDSSNIHVHLTQDTDPCCFAFVIFLILQPPDHHGKRRLTIDIESTGADTHRRKFHNKNKWTISYMFLASNVKIYSIILWPHSPVEVGKRSKIGFAKVREHLYYIHRYKTTIFPLSPLSLSW